MRQFSPNASRIVTSLLAITLRGILLPCLILTLATSSGYAQEGRAKEQSTEGQFRLERRPTSYTPLEILEQFEAPADEAYVLAGGDEITIEVWGRPELSGRQTIGPDGKITL